MTQYEYKVVKCRVVDQNYYTSWLAAYGWQVQNIQEVVDKVVNQSLGFSSNMGSGSMFGHAYYHPHTNTTAFSGYQTNHGWGTNMNTTVTQVQTKLTITFFRDINFPGREELNKIEAQWWKCSESYLGKVIDRGNTKGEETWPELIELKRIQSLAWEIRNRKKSLPASVQPKKEETVQKQPQQVENKPVQMPNIPASATIKNMEVSHNIFQSGQSGIQIRLCFTIQHRKGFSCGVLAYFRDEQGNGLVDLNNKFKTSSGHVCVGTSCKPDFEDALFNDYILFLPYAELDQPDGKRNLQFNVQIYDDIGKDFVAKSESVHFTFSKEGTNMRGESLPVEFAQKHPTNKGLTTETKPKPVTKPAKTIRPVSSSAVHAPNTSKKERLEKFALEAGWTELTEDRQLYIEGIFLSTDVKQDAALKNFQKALELNPKEERYWSAVSVSLASKGKLDESVNILEKGLRELPDNVLLKASLGQRYISLKDFISAEAISSELEKSSLPYAAYNALMIRACSAEQQGKYKDAINLFNQADAKADGPNPLTGLGQQRCQDVMKRKK
jgi:tetratricopeptide (TPR) repeat protein